MSGSRAHRRATDGGLTPHERRGRSELQSDQRPKPDYPHSDSTWPHSREVADEHFGKIPSAERQQIVHGNAARLYKLG